MKIHNNPLDLKAYRLTFNELIKWADNLCYNLNTHNVNGTRRY